MLKTQTSGIQNRISSDIKVETKQSNDGKAYSTATFQVAIDQGSYKGQDGAWVNRPAEFWTCRTSNPYLVEKLSKHAKKGMVIVFEGAPHRWSVKKDDGTYSNGDYIELISCDVITPQKSANGETAPAEETATGFVPAEPDYANVNVSDEDLPWMQ